MPNHPPPKRPNTSIAQEKSEPAPNAMQERSGRAKLVAPVVAQPPAAALPCNLTDALLELVARDLDTVLDENGAEDPDSQFLIAPLALVFHILVGQRNGAGFTVSLEDFLPILRDYRAEIGLELLKRRAGVQFNPATMTTIFSQREITFHF